MIPRLGARRVAAVALLLAGCASEPDMSDPLTRARVLDQRQREAEDARRERDRRAFEEQRRRERTASGAGAGAAVEPAAAEGAAVGAGARPGLGIQGGPASATASGPWKRDLLARYGPSLTSMQRSALQTARLESYEQGRTMCERWVEENRRFEAGGGADGGGGR